MPRPANPKPPSFRAEQPDVLSYRPAPARRSGGGERNSSSTRHLPVATFLAALTFLPLFFGCSHATHDSSSLTFLIESNPANLDPRFATDAQSQHIDGLLFSSLLERDGRALGDLPLSPTGDFDFLGTLRLPHN